MTVLWPNINGVDAVSMLSMEWLEPVGRKAGFSKSPGTSAVEGTPVEGCVCEGVE